MAESATSIINRKKDLQARNTSSINYPADIGDFYFALDFYEYRKSFGEQKSTTNTENNPLRQIYNAEVDSVNAAIKKSPFARIKLPIPANLTDTFNIRYDQESINAFAAAVGDATAAISGLNDGKDNLQADAAGEVTGIGSAASAALGGTAKFLAKQLVARQVLFGTDLGNLLDLATGQTLNPNLTVLFRGPTLKGHNFSWNITPRSKLETENVNKIIQTLKRASHPSQVGDDLFALLKYPCECLAQFVGIRNDRVFLYPLRPTVVESISVNYAPNGTPSFFQDTNDATSLNLSISLRETSYYTRESFSDPSQYGFDGGAA